MKVLTIKQPWAYLLAYGYKDVENRTWGTSCRERILLHSSGKAEIMRSPKTFFSPEQWENIPKNVQYRLIYGTKLPSGAIIGSAIIEDVVTNANETSVWAEEGCKHWKMKDPVIFTKPIEYVKGKLSLWEMTDLDLLKALGVYISNSQDLNRALDLIKKGEDFYRCIPHNSRFRNR